MQKYAGYIVLALIIILIIVIVNNKKKNDTKEIPNAVQNLIQTTGLGNVISSPNTTTNTTIPPMIKTSGYNFGDKLYAKENSVNTYKSASATSVNLASYKGYDKDVLIGTYLGKESVFVKVLIANPASSVFVLSNQIYSK